ncbi:MAG TPA: hydroxymethylglutaryl-CoA reductase [Prolixibacteraceae bacterium]|nr:hydroxymethylglutaryl-CoA reductase [Prolixibacteraceae bacterium]
MGKEKNKIIRPTIFNPNSTNIEPKGNYIDGFSKLCRYQRLNVLKEWMSSDVLTELDSFLHRNPDIQQTMSELSENYLTNFYLPFGVVPNVLINDEFYLVPMVVEESSVVAAAARAAGFWAKHGGFKTEVLATKKKGQVHFTWSGLGDFIKSLFPEIELLFYKNTETITAGMRSRGGGITAIELLDLSDKIDGYYQIDVSFETADAMGANFINTCLETMAETLTTFMKSHSHKGKLEVLMAILSNYTPESLVKCTVSCSVEELALMSSTYAPADFARRFELAVKMAQIDVSRAVTHNKGIYNGIDGVVLATGNDWRAVEAAGHAYAARNGAYSALSEVKVENEMFSYSITIPLSVGTVGGLTKNHPLAAFSLKLLRNPSANRLMEIIVALGMANNFSAVSSLVTSGIQKGHMKMHLANMLSQLGASEKQKAAAVSYFANKVVSYAAVQHYLKQQ